jgi:hypothetical protein
MIELKIFEDGMFGCGRSTAIANNDSGPRRNALYFRVAVTINDNPIAGWKKICEQRSI